MHTSVTSFTHAIVRRPGESAIHGLRVVDRGAPNLAALRREHAAYIDALTRVGVTVEVLDPLEQYPDSMFVEDPRRGYDVRELALDEVMKLDAGLSCMSLRW